jgi:hypothetical protein
MFKKQILLLLLLLLFIIIINQIWIEDQVINQDIGLKWLTDSP